MSFMGVFNVQRCKMRKESLHFVDENALEWVFISGEKKRKGVKGVTRIV